MMQTEARSIGIKTLEAAVIAAVVMGPLAVAADAPLGGPIWEEGTDGGGDAGRTPSDSQTTTGSGELDRIDGEITDGQGPLPDYVDLYLIAICDPLAFSASTDPQDGGLTMFDSQLFLFQPDPADLLLAFGLLANDEKFPLSGTSTILPLSTDGSGAMLTTPGLYYLGISVFDRDPFSPGGAIFDQVMRIEISGPDGPGGAGFLTTWLQPVFPPVGTYSIALAGTAYAAPSGAVDCNCNGTFDACDIRAGTSLDLDGDGFPDECACRADLDGDMIVGFSDVLLVLSSWGPCIHCFADTDCDGTIGFADLLTILSSWGPCP